MYSLPPDDITMAPPPETVRCGVVLQSCSRLLSTPFNATVASNRSPLPRAYHPFRASIFKVGSGSIAPFRQAVQQGLLFAHSGRRPERIARRQN